MSQSASAETNPLSSFTQSTFGKKISLAAGVVAVGAIMVGVWLWSQQPDYKVLFSNFNDRDGGAIIASLQQMNVPYKYAEGGGAILVPSANVHDARLKLASQGLPKGGNVGFELMENQKLGVSQFHEQVNFQRALEGELANSIQAISSVQTARIHLALPKSTVFVREQQKPTASVLLNLYPGRTLDQQQVSAVVHLVSSSVPDLPPGNVTIVDQNGNLLSDQRKPSTPAGLDATQLKYVNEVQRSIVTRIESIIAPIMGSKNVRAEATVDVDFSNTEQAAEIYSPNQPPNAAAIRSQQSNEALNGNAMSASGVPGSLSNQPPGPATAPIDGTPPLPGSSANGQAQTAVTKKDSVTNYEVDKTIKYTQQPMGGIKRISVAIVVNYKVEPDKKGKPTPRPLTDQEKQEITDLAKEAMGFNKDRGDSLNVVNSPFAGMEKEVIAEEPLMTKVQNYALTNITEIGKYTLGGIVLLYLFFGVMRPMLKKLTAKPVPPEAPEDVAEDNDESDTESATPAELKRPSQRSYEQKLILAKQMAKEDPRVVANVVKTWVNGNE
jgi:flagellar M-ring protein FliF